MNIYSKKQRWKAILFISALIIIGLSMAYTNILVDKISKEEESKIRLWAKTVSEKAELVRFANDLFARFKKEERKKGEIWAKSVKYLVSASSSGDVGFLFELVKSNETVPVIMTFENGKIDKHKNLDPTLASDSMYQYQQLELMKKINKPIEIVFGGESKRFLYYKDSKLFEELRYVLDEMLASFMEEVLTNSASVPVIYTDSTQKNILQYSNLHKVGLTSVGKGDSKKQFTEEELQETLESMRDAREPIKIELKDGTYNYIFYKKSFLLKQLQYYPFIQFFIIGLFSLVSYYLFSSSRKAEQNQVWVGMSKETAHQLGTPISSLMAWLEILEMKEVDSKILDEIRRDISRLEIITDRFSKIGSEPEMYMENLYTVVEDAIEYLKKRISKKVNFTLHSEVEDPMVKLSVPLFGWVIENLSKNAVDAMEGIGDLSFHITELEDKLYLDITDTGKGISKKDQVSIFKPGFTSKKRGWGLGLTLVQRIIDNYHSGKIFVKHSEVDKGTTFRIELQKTMEN